MAYLARQILVKKMKSHLVDLLNKAIIIVVVVVVIIIISSIIIIIIIIIIKRQARLASYWIRHLNIV